MIKKALYITLLCVFSFKLDAQSTFKKTISSLENDFAVCVDEDNKGNFIFSGFLQNPANGYSTGYILKLDKNGNLVDSRVFINSLSTIFSVINVVDNEYFFIGDERDPVSNLSRVVFLKTDTNLNTLSIKKNDLPIGFVVSLLTGIIDNDTNFVLTCTLSSFSSTLPYTPLMYKISSEGDSILSKIETFPNDSVSNNPGLPFLIEKNDSSGYLAFGLRILPTLPNGTLLNYDKNFNLLRIDTIDPLVTTSFSPDRFGEKLIIAGRISGVSPSSKSIQMALITDSNEVIYTDTIGFPNNESNLPARVRCVSSHNNSAYIGITKDMSFSGPFGSGLPSWFQITRVNPDLSKVWSKIFGGDFYYLMNGILATTDGGCLAFGTKYNYTTPTNQLDLYIIKIDSNGVITFTQEIDKNDLAVTVYPNPGKNEINIDTTINEGVFSLYTIDGKKVIEQNLVNQPINTTDLPKGIYIYKVHNSEKVLKTGKWVKQ